MESLGSLTQALQQAEAAFGCRQPAAEGGRVVASLLDRQVRTGRKAGLFALSDEDWRLGPRLWTGEPIRTKLAAEHVYSQETARLLHLLAGGDPAVARAVAAASTRLGGTCYAVQHCTIGECATSFIGYVRLLAAIHEESSDVDIAPRIATLSQHRLGDGRWRRFPLFYTALVLSELRLPLARAELLYAQPACLRAARHNSVEEPYARRRARLLRDAFGYGRTQEDEAPSTMPAFAGGPNLRRRRPGRG